MTTRAYADEIALAHRIERDFLFAEERLDLLLLDLTERGTFSDGEAAAHVETARRRLTAAWRLLAEEITAWTTHDAPPVEANKDDAPF